MSNCVANRCWTQPPGMLRADGCKTFVARVAILQNTEFTTCRPLSAKSDITVQRKPFTKPENVWYSTLTVVNLTITQRVNNSIPHGQREKKNLTSSNVF